MSRIARSSVDAELPTSNGFREQVQSQHQRINENEATSKGTALTKKKKSSNVVETDFSQISSDSSSANTKRLPRIRLPSDHLSDKSDLHDRYMDVSDVCNLFKVQKATVYGWTSRKAIPHIKLRGGKILFDPDKIHAWAWGFEVATGEKRRR